MFLQSSNLQRGAIALLLTLLSAQAFGQELNGANTSWIMTSTALVLFMTIPGLSLFYAGLVRSKNVLSVLMQCFAITCLASIIWLAFGYSIAFGDGGSALAANGDAGMAILVTHISAATGSLAWMMMEWIRHGKPSVLGIVTGMVAGLGTITPASGFVGPGGALVIGFSAGIVCYYATQAIKQKFKIDDSLDVFPVHGVGGILGTILAGVFASDALGVFSGQGFNEGMTMSSQVQVQIVGVVATFAYTAIITYLLLKLVDKLLVLRVDEEQELQGVDLVEHDEKGYDL